MVTRKILAAALLAGSAFLTAGAQASTLYSNGPLDGNTNGWNIVPPFAVADSFTVSSPSTATGANFAIWLFPDDTGVFVDWAILDDIPGTGNVLSSGTAAITNTFIFTNGFGVNVYNEAIAIGPQSLAAGTYWFELQNFVDSGNVGAGYWDINGGPSRAWESTFGEVTTCPEDIGGVPANNRCSDTFEILGTTLTKVPEPSTLLLLFSGLAGLGAVRRRKTAKA
jgi:hypothetical protein